MIFLFEIYTINSVADLGEPPPPPLLLDQTEARWAKTNFWRPDPLLYQGLDDRSSTPPPPPSLFEGLDPPLQLLIFQQDKSELLILLT